MKATHLLPLVALSLVFGLALQASAQSPGNPQQPKRILLVNPQPAQPPVLGFRGRMVCNGIRIECIDYDSLAFDLGLERGDVLTHINGLKITSARVYREAMLDAGLGDGRVRLRVENIRWHTGESSQRFVNRLVLLHQPCPPPVGDIEG